MSQRWDQVEERLDEYESQLDTVYRLYHLPVLAALVVFMLWIRLRHFGRHIGEDGGVLYRGNDPFYHYRSTNYVIENYPYTMPFDPWTGFDVGQRVGQFGTILDQTVATIALILGLGSPSETTVIMTTLLVAPVVAALCVIPMYYIGAHLGGRFGGIIAVLLLAVTPGQFLSVSVAGFYDHHIVEAFFSLLVLAVGIKMLTVAQTEQPIYELLKAKDFEPLRTPLMWAAAFGVVLTLAILTWPPAVFLLGLYAIFLYFQLSLEFVRGYSPDHVAIPSIVAMLVFTILFLPFITTLGFTVTDYSLVQPILALAVAGGAIFMAAAARLWERTDTTETAYPVTITGIGLVGIALIALVLPEFFDFFVSQIERVAGLGSTDTAATIGEAQAPDNPSQFFFQSYGLAFYTALAGLALIAYRLTTGDRPRGDYLLVLVFTVLLILFTMTQRRFDYYLVIGIGAANAYLVGRIYQFVDLQDVREDITNIQGYQILIVVAIVFVIAGPMLVTGSTLASADANSNPGEIQQWSESLDWLAEETPEPGSYGTGNEPRLEYYGRYDITDDFEYRDGEYGVLAWWDYGHYITTRGERIPVANPFQQHATESADFLLADEEDEAIAALEDDSGEAAGVQYIMVDYQLGYAGTPKYSAPTAFDSRHNVGRADVGINVVNPQSFQTLYGVHTQRAYESMRVRLYQFHGSARNPARFITRFGEYSPQDGLASPPQEASPIEEFETVAEAREAAEQSPNAIHGGVFGQPAERVSALQHFRLVHAGGPQAASPFQRAYQLQGTTDSWVKTFERLDGATVEGTGPANTEVEATVEMEIGSTGETFTYSQVAETDDDGNFEMVVPYSTTGYDEYGTDAGYTNVDVRANGSYQFFAIGEEALVGWTGETDVTEGQVLGEDDTVVEVALEANEDAVEPTNTTTDTDGTATESAGDAPANGDTTGEEPAANDTADGEQATQPRQRPLAP